MENDKLDGTQEIAIVPSGEATAELIPEPTAGLIRKSFAENTLRNRRLALQHFQQWLQGRQITDGLLAEYITYLLFSRGQSTGTISIVVAAVKWLLKHRNGGKPVEMPITAATLAGIRREGRVEGVDSGVDSRGVKLIRSVLSKNPTARFGGYAIRQYSV